jgi:hypothetical protein
MNDQMDTDEPGVQGVEAEMEDRQGEASEEEVAAVEEDTDRAAQSESKELEVTEVEREVEE